MPSARPQAPPSEYGQLDSGATHSFCNSLDRMYNVRMYPPSEQIPLHDAHDHVSMILGEGGRVTLTHDELANPVELDEELVYYAPDISRDIFAPDSMQENNPGAYRNRLGTRESTMVSGKTKYRYT